MEVMSSVNGIEHNSRLKVMADELKNKSFFTKTFQYSRKKDLKRTIEITN